MESSHADCLSMLLSSDWFAPYWSTLHLSVELEKSACIRKSCREIVESMTSSASEYYHIDFSEERVQRTRSGLLGAFQACDADPAVAGQINALITREQASGIDDATGWLVVTLTGMLLRNSMPSGGEPGPGVKAVVSRIGGHCELSSGMDWSEICLNSETAWDYFLKGLTPDQPTALCDYLSSILSRDKFERLWADMHGVLQPQDRKAALEWYRRAAQALTGDELRIPTDN